MTVDSLKTFPKTCTLIQEGIEKKLHTGVQLSIKLHDQVFDFGVGEAKPNVPMTSEIILPWLSAAKPITVIALAKLIDQKQLHWLTPLFQFFPEWGYDNYKSRLTLKHLLTHTAGLEEIDHGWPLLGWQDTLARVINAPPHGQNQPGERAAYSPQVNWFLLGEVISRITRLECATAIQKLVLDPLKLLHTRCVYYSNDPLNKDRGDFYERVKGELQTDIFKPRLEATSPSPGSSFYGPASDLRKVMDLFLYQGQHENEQVISPERVSEILSLHRGDMFDHTLQHKVDYGLGVILNSSHHGMETVPYGFGRHASPQAFGHGGAQSSMSFADPAFKLTGVIIANGRAGEGQHQRRHRDLMTAIYEDLGLVVS